MITASIVTYDTPINDLKNCISSLFNKNNVFLVYIIDNKSSVEIEKFAFKNERLIYHNSGSNLGYAKGHNIAIAKAMKIKSTYHLVINADVIVKSGLIPQLITNFQDPDTGIISVSLKNDTGTEYIQTKLIPSPLDLISRITPLGKIFLGACRRFQMQSFYDGRDKIFSPYISGCFMLFELKKIKTLGKFDERFFLYPEDIDLSRRFAAGYKNIIIMNCSIMHKHGAGSKKNINLFFIHLWNIAKYFNKYGWIFDRERKLVNKKYNSLNVQYTQNEYKK